MMGLRLAQACAAVAALAVASAADAAVIFDNGAPDLGSAGLSDFSPTKSVITVTNQIAENFSLATAAGLTTVRWGGMYAGGNSPVSDDFVIRIHAQNINAPAIDPLHEFDIGNVGRTKTGSTILGFDLYTYEAVLPTTSLAAGTYWLSLVNNLADDPDDAWYWATSATSGGDAANRPADGIAWTPTDLYAYSFSLTDDIPAAVPEPLGAGLLAAGLGCLAWRRHCRG